MILNSVNIWQNLPKKWGKHSGVCTSWRAGSCSSTKALNVLRGFHFRSLPRDPRTGGRRSIQGDIFDILPKNRNCSQVKTNLLLLDLWFAWALSSSVISTRRSEIWFHPETTQRNDQKNEISYSFKEIFSILFLNVPPGSMESGKAEYDRGGSVWLFNSSAVRSSQLRQNK